MNPALTGLVARRPPGQNGRRLQVTTNMFELQCFPKSTLSQYDVVIYPEVNGDAIRRQREIINKMQDTYTNVFTPSGAYDGQRTMYSPAQYSFGDSASFTVLMANRPPPADKPTKGVYTVSLTLVAVMQPQMLLDFVQGRALPSNKAIQVLNALNVIIRMAPINMHPHNARNFYPNTPANRKALRKGIVLNRGYFQSIRPSPGRCLVNIDITTGAVWQRGPLSNIVLEVLRKRDMRELENLSQREIRVLTEYFKGVRIYGSHRTGSGKSPSRSIQRFDADGADRIRIEETGQNVTTYFRDTYNKRLDYPKACCVWISKSAALPLELCIVEDNQLFKRKIPAEFMKDVLDFSTKRPDDRLRSIMMGLPVMEHDNSPFMRQSGLAVSKQAIRVDARALTGPTLNYGGRQTLNVRDGAWNLRNLKFLEAKTVRAWAVVLLDTRDFNTGLAENFVKALVQGMEACGMTVLDRQPPIETINPQDSIKDNLLRIGSVAMSKTSEKRPQLLVIVTSGSPDLYTQVKHFGDITHGIATQHVTVQNAKRPTPQYCANVAMKINLKLGGKNHAPTTSSIEWISKGSPIIVMGADASHPGSGDGERPTIAALSSSVDADATMYVTSSIPQRGRQEIIEDLKPMVKNAVRLFQQYQGFMTSQRSGKPLKEVKPIIPGRVLFYRDGVSEGQFAEVCQREVMAIREAFHEEGWGNPNVTFVVVGKRHHVRFFPEHKDADKSGNAPSGLVVDTDINHPQSWDFYLQSHAGLKGTSRPMHASIITDDNAMTSDGLQQLTFALTHNFGRATRAVSIPSPVYYAHIACGRAKIHYDDTVSGSDDMSVSSEGYRTLEQYKRAYMAPHQTQRTVMYWM